MVARRGVGMRQVALAVVGKSERAIRPGKVKQMSGLDAVRQWDGVLDADLFVKPGDTIRPVKTGADRAGFIITGAKTRDEALALGEKAEQSLVFEYEA